MEEIIVEQRLRVPIKSWLPRAELDHATLDQLRAVARHPDVATHVAVMPDCHVGAAVTIGCVFPTIGSVVPAAVGSDIGCGMAAVATGLAYDPARHDRSFWQGWAERVRRAVPVGFGAHDRMQRWSGFDEPLRARDPQAAVRDEAARQLGTLGGGNHFMEAQVDEAGSIWLMVHSGSRRAGGLIARHYDGLARTVDARRSANAPPGLGALPLDDQVGQDFLHDMDWAARFALKNRYLVLERMLAALDLDAAGIGGRAAFINIHHNFAREEEHFGQRVVVHRKGATSARADELGLIPGSMGAKSYVVHGRGHPESFSSCSHGAGRRLSRGRAREEIDTVDLAIALLEAGVHTPALAALRDEAPQVYKDVEQVLARQADLVEIVQTLRPLMTIKGDLRARDD